MSMRILDENKVKKVLYGGDYNPEQWDEATWEKDYEMFSKAGIDIVTLNVFNWAMLQPNEETYDFSRLDASIKRAEENGVNICLATATAAHPAWMAKKYPDVLRTEINGMKRKFGKRHNSCPNSPTFRKYSVALASELAKRYKEQENIVIWHINNEYGGNCYCENCEKAFRVWLRKRYQTLDALNRAWNTNFWGHTFYDWDEIVSPTMLSEMEDEEKGIFHGMLLDYRRFNSEGMMNNCIDEAKAIKAVIPDARVTTNFMGAYKPLDYQKWAPYLDVISWDNYPGPEEEPAHTALNHELMRGLKKDQPFMLMESTPGVVNWRPYNRLREPGQMRLHSYQAIAHGADTVMFFQLRMSPGASEKFHGAVIDHSGRDDTRIFKEVCVLGEELKVLGDEFLGSVSKPKAALIFDWETWWAVEGCIGPTVRLRYHEELLNYYRAFHSLNIPVDVVGMDTDLSEYKVVVAPLCYMIKDGFEQKLKDFTQKGGTSVITFFSGYADESDRIINGGFPGKMMDLFGIWAEEIDALAPTEENSFTYNGITYPAKLLCDLIHANDTQILSSYEKRFYAGTPVITKNTYGQGNAYYVGTQSSKEFYQTFIKDICNEAGVDMVLYENIAKKEYPVCGLEITKRVKDGTEFVFLLNHQMNEESVELPFSANDLLTGSSYQAGDKITIGSMGVVILKKDIL